MMQENRVRSTSCFVSKPREASPERPTRRKDRGDAASTPHLLDPTEAHWDGLRSLLEEVRIIPSWRFYDPLGPRQVCRVVASWLTLRFTWRTLTPTSRRMGTEA